MSEIGYARVSTDEQARDSSALKQQINRLLKAGVDEIFVDVQSGKDDDRPEFEKVVQRIRERTCQGVTITRDDRIARHGVMSLQLLELFEQSQVRLRILDAGQEAIDLSNPYHWKQRAQAGIDAEFENRIRAMSIKRGYEAFRAEGKANSRPPFGFIRVDEHYQPSPESWEAARGSVELFFETRTLQGTLRLIDERYNKQWSANGFRRWLLNPVLQGHTGYLLDRKGSRPHQQILYNTHQPLITSEEAEQIRAILKDNKTFWGRNKTAQHYPLGGLMFCGQCGTKMTIAHGDDHIYVWCRQRKNKLLSQPCAQKHTPRYEVVETAVIDALVAKAAAIAPLAETPPKQIDSPELQVLKAELDYYNNAPGIRARDIVTELRQQIEALRHQQSEVSDQWSANRELLLRVFSDHLFWFTLPEADKQKIYRALVDRVVIIAFKVETGELSKRGKPKSRIEIQVDVRLKV